MFGIEDNDNLCDNLKIYLEGITQGDLYGIIIDAQLQYDFEEGTLLNILGMEMGGEFVREFSMFLVLYFI